MPVIIGTSTYPSHKQVDFVKKFLSITGKYDMDAVTVKNVGAVTTFDGGIKIMNMWEVEAGKLEEALLLANQMYYEYILIEGFESTVEVWFTGNEAADIAGVKLPE